MSYFVSDMLTLIEPETKKIKEIIGDDKADCAIADVSRPSLSGFNLKVRIRKPSVTEPTWIGESQYAAFQLTQFPGNCGILVSHDTSVDVSWRNKGISTILQDMKEKLARYCNYTMMYATTIPTNEHEIKVLTKKGWTKAPELFIFTNRRSGNPITLWWKPVPKAEETKTVQAAPIAA